MPPNANVPDLQPRAIRLSDILEKIVATKWQEIESHRQRVPMDELIRQCQDLPATRGFTAALANSPPLRLIAEVKKASPSAGLIREDFDPVRIARDYHQAGASCLSVLTDENYFQGHLDYLNQIRQAVPLPLLRKDFIVDPYQVYQARVAGADAILLIAECLDPEPMKSLYDLARSLGLDVLIELHDPVNLEKVLATGTRLVGVNNRDLHTFEVDTQRTIEIRSQVPAERLIVGESGVKDRELVQSWEDAGVNAMLVGETLMRQSDIQAAVRNLLGT